MSGDNQNKEENVGRVVIVSGPKGFSPENALFAEGVQVSDEDVVVAIERPGNVNVEVLEE